VTLSTEKLLAALAAELERPRTVTAQVANHVIETYNIARDELGAFLRDNLAKLEDYEIDLILSPLFTPTLNDQALFAEILGRECVSVPQIPTLVQQLVAGPTIARLLTDDDATHAVALREVTIERFVHRLRLEGAIPEELFDLINNLTPASDRPVLKAIARRGIWERETRREILTGYLTKALNGGSFRVDDAVQLVKLIETYEPANIADLLTRIPHWQQVLRQEINEASSPKPFFNERVQELHGGGRDQRRQDNNRVTMKENEQAFLERLQRLLTNSES
jgi:hypothetical protein